MVLGIKLAGASTAALINSTNPVVITLLAGFILKESLTVIKRVCLFLALLGTFIITQGASGSGEIMGILFMIISVSLLWVCLNPDAAPYPKVCPHLDYVLWNAHWQSPFSPCGIYSSLREPVSLTPFVVLVLLLPWHHGDPVWPSLHGPRLCLNCRQVPVRFFIRSKPFFLLFWVPICSESPFTVHFYLGLILISADILLNFWDTRRNQFPEKS